MQVDLITAFVSNLYCPRTEILSIDDIFIHPCMIKDTYKHYKFIFIGPGLFQNQRWHLTSLLSNLKLSDGALYPCLPDLLVHLAQCTGSLWVLFSTMTMLSTKYSLIFLFRCDLFFILIIYISWARCMCVDGVGVSMSWCDASCSQCQVWRLVTPPHMNRMSPRHYVTVACQNTEADK